MVVNQLINYKIKGYYSYGDYQGQNYGNFLCYR